VVDALAEVIDWHHRHLVPLGAGLSNDPRCRLVHGDFFDIIANRLPFAADAPAGIDVILLDIDHSPRHVLHPRHAAFYEPDGLRRLIERLRSNGVFALWSNDPPDDEFLAVLRAEFASAEAHVVTFPNFYSGIDASSTIYVAIA
jgi:spermidine synthase